jgi:quercetin 2,3-dioxygenase
MPETLSRATIYLSGQRGCTQVQDFRSFHTFNFGTYHHDHRKPTGSLTAFNDDTLGGKASVTHTIVEDTLIMLLPIVGGIEFQIKDGHRSRLDAGECTLISIAKGSTLKVTNPYDDLVNFISAWFSPDVTTTRLDMHSVFDLDEKKDTLVRLFSFRNIEGYIGKFKGRTGHTYKLQNYSGSTFAFVIEGAFEFQNRLIELRDGLLISNVQAVEFEALSNDAVVLILEI